MKPVTASKTLFTVVLLVLVAGALYYFSRPPRSGPAAPIGTGGGRGQGGGAGGNAAGGQAGAAAGAAGKKAEAPQAAATEPKGFFARIMARIQKFFGAEEKKRGFFQRLKDLFTGGSAGPAAPEAGIPGEAGAPGQPEKPKGGGKPGQAQPAQDPAIAEVNRQMKENLEQTLEQQRMMREMQNIQRQNLENIKMTIQTQQQTRQAIENAKRAAESSRKP
jgi:hypothetical protein